MITESSKSSQYEAVGKVTVDYALKDVVDTHFFVNQPRESEDIADVYKSVSAVSGLWKSLDKDMGSEIKHTEEKVLKASKDSKEHKGSKNSNDSQDSKQNKSSDSAGGKGEHDSNEKRGDLRETFGKQYLEELSSDLSRFHSAAESSPSPAARGPGTPFTPYGTPPPFAHQRRNLDNPSRFGDDNDDDDDESMKDYNEDKGPRQHSIVTTDKKATRKPMTLDNFPRSDAPLPNVGSENASSTSRRPDAPTGDLPPGFEDEYEMLPSLRGDPVPSRAGIPSLLQQPQPGSSSSYGDSDLYPPGMNPHQGLDPLGRPTGGTGSGPGPFPSGGMHPTFADIQGINNRNRGGFSQGDEDDQNNGFPGGPPPGARWDPTGPFGGPGGPGGLGGSGTGGSRGSFNRYF